MRAENIIAGLSEQLTPVRQLATRLLVEGSKEVPHGIAIGPRPLVAPEYHALYIFAAVLPHDLDRYENRFSIIIPPTYKSVLAQIGGLLAFEFALFGIPASMTLDPPLLDRSYVQPHDLSTAESDWKRSYAIEQKLFHFGSGPYTEDEHIGYFLDQSSEQIRAYRKNGDLFQSWESISDFLGDELQRASNTFPKYEACMRNAQQVAGADAQPTSLLRRIMNRWR